MFLFSVVVCVQTVESLAEKIVFLIFYHFILALFIWSYFKTIFAPKCETPSKWKLSPGKVHSNFCVLLKVRMNLWSHRFSKKHDEKLTIILPSLHRAEILAIFRSYFGRNDDFINSFRNYLTFSATKYTFALLIR